MAGILLYPPKNTSRGGRKMAGELNVCMAPSRNYFDCVEESTLGVQPAQAHDTPVNESMPQRDPEVDTFTNTHAKGRFVTNTVVGTAGCGLGYLSGNPLIAMGVSGTLVALNDFFIGQAHVPGDRVPSTSLHGGAFSRWGDVLDSANDGSLRYPDRPVWKRAATAVAMGTAYGLACGLATGALWEERARGLVGSEAGALMIGTAMAEAADKSAGLTSLPTPLAFSAAQSGGLAP